MEHKKNKEENIWRNMIYRRKKSYLLKNRTMSDSVLTYLLYAVLVVVFALVGRYIGKVYDYPGTGTVIGGLVGVGLVYWHANSSDSSTSMM